ncbi:MAG: VWA domain-containing protein [Gammaproteobacteria bacterium]|nr:VWA domain-containing protein [Gammaproteobacteria bacterium]MDH3857896.1 VWA domain-containing protein [Gammaproteobacteria bacterium]
MSESVAFQFLNPGWLLLLAPAWWLVWIFSKHAGRQSMWSRVCDPRLLDKMIAGGRTWNSTRMLTWILGLVLTLSIIAAAGPSWRKQSHPILESTSARVVALDLSRSMLVKDVEPTRFDNAIAAAREIIGTEFDGETGLVVFAGRAFVVSPLSRDAKTLLAFLEALDPSTMPEDGTRIDLAIGAAQDLLTASFAGVGQILIITAGASNDSTATIQAARVAAGQGHRISVLAIGTAQGGPLADPGGQLLRDNNGKVVLARTNFKLLERITDIGNGTSIALNRNSGNSGLLISRLGASALIESERNADSSQRAAANDGAWIVWLVLPFALVLFRKNLIWMILLSVLIPGERELYAKEWDSFWQHREKLAYQYYLRGDYQSSLALSSDPRLQGAAYYRDGQYQQALEYFDVGDSAGSLYNLGNTLAHQNRFSEAIIAYQKALDLEPALEPARYNKRLLELYLEQQADSGGEQYDGSAGDESSAEFSNSTETETRIGVAESMTNPADDPQIGPGLGASLQPGQVDPFERFDGREEALQRFVLRAQQGEQSADPEFMERWIRSLPETSTDLFRRIFLRDAQRQERQPK